MAYVGLGAGESEVGYDEYDWVGGECRRLILSVLPGDWTFSGKRVLDFGCGAGRVIRHFAEEARSADFTGCDIDPASIDWAEGHLDPPFRFLSTGESPPLPLEASSFDLIYGMSIFTHLTDSWSAWLLELRRLLKPNGVLVLSFLGQRAIELITGERYDDANFGCNAIALGNPWSRGGPTVLHAPWWLRAHWGRAFDILALDPGGDPGERLGHGAICLRKNDRPAPTAPQLEVPEAAEARELSWRRHNVAQLRGELRHLRREAFLKRRGLDGSRVARLVARLAFALSPRAAGRGPERVDRQLRELKPRVASARRELEGMGDPGLEPGTSSLSETRSNQLS
jgi:SAM-dependent methyltransferase